MHENFGTPYCFIINSINVTKSSKVHSHPIEIAILHRSFMRTYEHLMEYSNNMNAISRVD